MSCPLKMHVKTINIIIIIITTIIIITVYLLRMQNSKRSTRGTIIPDATRLKFGANSLPKEKIRNKSENTKVQRTPNM